MAKLLWMFPQYFLAGAPGCIRQPAVLKRRSLARRSLVLFERMVHWEQQGF